MDGAAPQQNINGLVQMIHLHDNYSGDSNKLDFGSAHFHCYYEFMLNSNFINER